MNLLENLIQYTEYSKGDISKKCSIAYEDIDIVEFDFSQFDLNNVFFGGVNFDKCIFENVYLSGSNFCGSFLKECILKRNIINKATWDDMVIEKTKMFSMNAFRTTFMYGKFQDSDFSECYFEKCSFNNSDFQNVYFKECTIKDTDFTESKFDNVQFIRCKFDNVKFNENDDKKSIFIN